MCISLTACGTISKEKAIDIALDSLGMSRVYTPRNDAELDESVTPAVYKVTVWTESGNHVITVNAKTGDIISSTIESVERN